MAKAWILLWVIDNKKGEHLIIYIESHLFIIGNPSHEFVFIVFSDEGGGIGGCVTVLFKDKFPYKFLKDPFFEIILGFFCEKLGNK